MRFVKTLLLLAALGISSSALRADDWGNLKGTASYDGEVPAKVTLNVDKDTAHCLSKGALSGDEWVVNAKNKGVRWVFVWLTPAQGGSPLKIHPKLADVPKNDIVIDQPCCVFEPHAVALRQGQKVVVKNSSPISHNVSWLSPDPANPSGNLSTPSAGQVEIKELKASAKPIKFSCSIHPWMAGWIRVFDHPYFAITDADGNFEIKDAPVGKYNLVVWHEGMGWGAGGKNGQPVTIEAGKTTDLGKLSVKKTD